MGRVINAFGKPIDGKGLLAKGRVAYPLKNSPRIDILSAARNRRENG